MDLLFGWVYDLLYILHIRFHDLRHSCASIMIANGVSMKQVQEWLGHADFAITADYYTHFDFSAKINSSHALEKALSLELPEPDGQAGASGEKQPGESKYELFRQMVVEMTALGFTNAEEYMEYLNKSSPATPRPNKDFEM